MAEPPTSESEDGPRLCPGCGQENSVTAHFCGECGARLVGVCPACGREEPLCSQHCSACGTPLTQASSETSSLSSGQGESDDIPSAARRAPEAGRRHLTVLFCDVINATALSVGLDPEAYRDLIAAYHAACAEVIARLEGHIAQYLGDGLLVYFGYPRAHEDDAQRAVRAGLGIVDALKPLQERLQREQAERGLGRVILLSGEAGIGKSRLVRAVEERLAGEPCTRLECRCLPYTQQSALYPLIDPGRRLLQWQRDEPSAVTIGKLEVALAPYDETLPEAVPLLAALLSLPLPERCPPLQLTPQRQKQKTLETIVALMRARAVQQPVLIIVEDLRMLGQAFY